MRVNPVMTSPPLNFGGLGYPRHHYRVVFNDPKSTGMKAYLHLILTMIFGVLALISLIVFVISENNNWIVAVATSWIGFLVLLALPTQQEV